MQLNFAISHGKGDLGWLESHDPILPQAQFGSLKYWAPALTRKTWETTRLPRHEHAAFPHPVQLRFDDFNDPDSWSICRFVCACCTTQPSCAQQYSLPIQSDHFPHLASRRRRFVHHSPKRVMRIKHVDQCSSALANDPMSSATRAPKRTP